MRIRRAEHKDMDGLNRLLRQVLDVHHKGRPDLFKGGEKKYTDAELADIINDNSRPIFVAVNEQDQVLGYCFCIVKQLQDNIMTDVKTLYIDDLCVDENCRGQHIGSELYHFVRDFAKEQGCYNLTLNVWALNPGAIKFYEKCGLLPQKYCMETIL